MRTVSQLLHDAQELDSSRMGAVFDMIIEMLGILDVHQHRIADLEKQIAALNERITKLERTPDNFMKLNSPAEFVPSPPTRGGGPSAESRIEAAVDLCANGNATDGSHHKQWHFDQIVRALLSDGAYAAFRNRYRTTGETWDEGIAP